MSALAALFEQYEVSQVFGIHLVHGHFLLPEDTVPVGENHDCPHSRWARQWPVEEVPETIHGHIFVLERGGFHPYEYQIRPVPDTSHLNPAFFADLAEYLQVHGLAKLVGLQVLNRHPPMLELVLPASTIMMKESDLKGCKPTRRTGWVFEIEDGGIMSCQANETHGTRTDGEHDVFNKGSSLVLDTFSNIITALRAIHILF
jgi:hypothetical protein